MGRFSHVAGAFSVENVRQRCARTDCYWARVGCCSGEQSAAALIVEANKSISGTGTASATLTLPAAGDATRRETGRSDAEQPSR